MVSLFPPTLFKKLNYTINKKPELERWCTMKTAGPGASQIRGGSESSLNRYESPVKCLCSFAEMKESAQFSLATCTSTVQGGILFLKFQGVRAVSGRHFVIHQSFLENGFLQLESYTFTTKSYLHLLLFSFYSTTDTHTQRT